MDYIKNICASLRLHIKFKTLFMSDEEKHGHNLICHSSLIYPCNFWPLGLSAMLSVFKLASCKPEASRELDLRTPKA